MKISYEQLIKLQPLQKVIVQSLDLSLYRIMIEHDGQMYWLVDRHDALLRIHSLMAARELLSEFQISELVMQHQSAYDEMIGQPLRESNLLEVPIGKDLNPYPRTYN